MTLKKTLIVALGFILFNTAYGEDTTENNLTKEQIENVTQKYKTEWFDKAVETYNSKNPKYPWEKPYFSYKFPDDADFEAGNPPDKPLTGYEWLEIAGVGFTKKISIPTGPYSYDEKLVEEWKKRGLRAGRFHISFQQQLLDKSDPTGRRLDKEKLKVLKDACELFTNAGIPVVISTGGDMTATTLNNDWEGTFDREINYWRQLAEYFKDVSYLLAFENFIECHAFNSKVKHEWYLRVYVDNNESRFPDYTWRGKPLIDNYVTSLGYNNLNAEIAKVVRVTNPKRVMIYKPGGTGRTGMRDITPWRWGSEPDYLNNKEFYWVISAGGAANMRTAYVYGLRESDEEIREKKINTAKSYSWGPILNYAQHTQLPVWISLFGIKTNDRTITSDEVVSYINWYLDSVQSTVYNPKTMKRTRIPTGFQQSWWLWHFGIAEPFWKETTMYNWKVSDIVDALGSHSFGGGLTPKYYPPKFLTEVIKRDGASVNSEFNSTIFYDVVSDKEDNITFIKVSGPEWLRVLPDGTLKGVPTIEDIGLNQFEVGVVNYKGELLTNPLEIEVTRYKEIEFISTDDSECQKYSGDKNLGYRESIYLRRLNNRYAKLGFFKFKVDTNKEIKEATLRLFMTGTSNDLNIYLVNDNSWDENSITWNNRPLDITKVATPFIETGGYVDINVSSIVREDGTYSFELETPHTDFKIYTKESKLPPKLVISVE